MRKKFLTSSEHLEFLRVHQMHRMDILHLNHLFLALQSLMEINQKMIDFTLVRQV